MATKGFGESIDIGAEHSTDADNVGFNLLDDANLTKGFKEALDAASAHHNGTKDPEWLKSVFVSWLRHKKP